MVMVVDVSSAGVVPGLAELVSKKMDVVALPSVENWSCVVPLMVWKTLGFAPPEVRPVTNATAPVMSPVVPSPTPSA